MTRSGVRLQKFIAQAGLTSRRKAEEWIRAGRVQVNDRVVTEMGVVIDPSVDVVKVDGHVVEPLPTRRYVALYKPRFCVTTLYDPQGRPTVMDFVTSIRERIYPVGRLDFDAEGLLLLTNDGELAHRLIHPSYGVKKEYLVLVKGHPGKWFFQKWRDGVYLEEGKTSPAEVYLVKRERLGTWVRVIMHQGWYRQIKRMGQVTGYPVLRIKRIAYGPITLEGLKPGKFRELSRQEVRELYRLTGLNREGL
ncbi:pseudouridine synthase [Thermodesulforhabdus norvegica]|uniref:Pseudouridine synthase n=1 Tax=Thermodesulforhabdus norvegica TaxID=39841 RepID=A0A1I4UA80_9BACT|nr:pseudouridine synthase [Thermodesulforhabdus norvegica]SFM85825.1 ribosomal large subunit pseudouridine synthase B [Thermodesulforhabdus norvegica]